MEKPSDVQSGGALSIAGWDSLYESPRSRLAKKMQWIPIQASRSDVAFWKLCALRDGMSIYGTWITLLRIAADCPTRGVLAGRSGALTNSELASMTGGTVEEMARAITILTQLGWLNNVTATDSYLQQPCNSSATVLQQLCDSSVAVLQQSAAVPQQEKANFAQLGLPNKDTAIVLQQPATELPQSAAAAAIVSHGESPPEPDIEELFKEEEALKPTTASNVSNASVKKRSKPRSTELPILPDELKPYESSISDWLAYKAERRESYKPTGLKALYTKLMDFGSSLPDAISASMASNYAGIFAAKTGGGPTDRDYGFEPNDSEIDRLLKKDIWEHATTEERAKIKTNVGKPRYITLSEVHPYIVGLLDEARQGNPSTWLIEQGYWNPITNKPSQKYMGIPGLE